MIQAFHVYFAKKNSKVFPCVAGKIYTPRPDVSFTICVHTNICNCRTLRVCRMNSSRVHYQVGETSAHKFVEDDINYRRGSPETFIFGGEKTASRTNCVNTGDGIAPVWFGSGPVRTENKQRTVAKIKLEHDRSGWNKTGASRYVITNSAEIIHRNWRPAHSFYVYNYNNNNNTQFSLLFVFIRKLVGYNFTRVNYFII